MKAAINVGHPGCIGSLQIMLGSLGIELAQLSDKALVELEIKTKHNFGVKRIKLIMMGYAKPSINYIDLNEVKGCDIYVDVKEKNLDIMGKLFPHLKLLHFVINSGKEYGESKYSTISANKLTKGFVDYVPFYNQLGLKPRKVHVLKEAIELLHNPRNWGFGQFIDEIHKLGVKFYGEKEAPDGVLDQCNLAQTLSTAKAFVHLKGADCPGYALYESMAAAVPVIIPHMFISRTQYKDWLVPEETCLAFGEYAYIPNPNNPDNPLNETWTQDRKRVIREIKHHLKRLDDYKFNEKIGKAGYEQWKKLTSWTEDKADRLEKYLKQTSIL